MSGIHSTGRGGAGNIGKDDDVEYTDASIVREGPLGQPGAGTEYTTGRGGAGNVSQPSEKPSTRLDEEVVPETATRPYNPGSEYDNYHTGRGGQGNVHKEKFGGHSTHKELEEAEKRKVREGSGEKEGFGEKVKKALGVDKVGRSGSKSREHTPNA